MSRWPGATWCDVCQDGRLVAVVGPEVCVWPLGGDVSIVAHCPEPLGWLRADVSGRGALACVGQGQSGQGWLWAGGTWQPLGQTYGISPLEIVQDGLGWLVWQQTHADRYDLLTLSAVGAVLTRVPYAMPATATGFLDATDPALLLTDRARVVGGLMLPNLAGKYLVGQDPHGERLLLGDREGTPLRVLDASGPCWEPRAAWVDGRVVACSRSDDGGAVMVVGRPEDFPLWRPAAPPEPPTPPVEPPSGGSPVSMLKTLETLRLGYGRTMTDDECVEMLNAAAWSWRAEGYGLSRKETGTRGRRYDGQECCHDVLMWKDGTYWDCLAAAGAASVPQWGTNGNGQPSGTITDPARGWIAPIVPQGSVEPPVPPDPPPAGDLEARLAALEQWRVDVSRYVVRTATEWPR